MPDPQKPRDLPPLALRALAQGKKIDAIKIVRQEWGVGLKDAKDAVDAIIRTRPDLAATVQESSAASQRGCLVWVICLALVGVAIVYYLRR